MEDVAVRHVVAAHVADLKKEIKMSTTLSKADLSDLPFILELLMENNLPVADIKSMENFFVLKSDSAIEGCIALEKYNEYALLRSLSVRLSHRGNGSGMRLVSTVENHGQALGLKKIFLLTTTAETYFKKAGYEIIERHRVPESIKRSTEFASICPSTAVVMMKVL